MKHPLISTLGKGLAVLMVATLAACQDDELPQASQEGEATDQMLEAYHDKERTQPYPKADNELYLNPPPLIVPRSMKQDGCLLQFQLSTDSLFSAESTQEGTAQAWCMFNPHRTLEDGTWYWRFRNVDEAGTAHEWSTVYRFEVTPDVPRFVTPEFQAFYDNAPRNYPRLHCYLNGYIDQARTNAPQHAEYNRLNQVARQAIEADLTSQPDFYSQASTLRDHVSYLEQAYYLTQRTAYANQLHKVLTAILTTPPTDSQLFTDNFTTTDIALCVLPTYDLLYPQLTDAERRGAEDLMLRVIRHAYPQHVGTEENHIFDNHFWQQNMRVMFQIAFLLYDNPDYSAEVLPMLQYYYELWTARAPATGFNRDGTWINGTGYFINNVYTLYYMPMVLSYVARKDFLQHPWYLNAGRAMVYTWPPQSGSLGFGDGVERYDTPQRQRAAFADFLAGELRDSYAGWYADQCSQALVRDPDMRLYRMAMNRTYDTNLPALAKMMWYKDAGEVVMHSHLNGRGTDVGLSFRSSTFGSGSHTLADQNAFKLLYGGQNVYISTGYYRNFSDAHNLMSYRHSRAHNTILVNGIGQPYSTKGYGSVLRGMEGEHITYCLGDASHAYGGISDDPMWEDAFALAGISQTPENGFGTTPLTKYRRHLLMLHPDGIVVLYDELEASEAATFQWLLHSADPLTADDATGTIRHTSADGSFTATTQLFADTAPTFSVTDQFVVPPTAQPDPAYPNQWHLTAAFEGQERVRILAILQVTPTGTEPVEVTRNGNTLTIGQWSITAQLDASQEASLTVTHADQPVLFSYGSDNPMTDEGIYYRQYRHSSVLYDQVDGVYTTTEQGDELPANTRVLP